MSKLTTLEKHSKVSCHLNMNNLLGLRLFIIKYKLLLYLINMFYFVLKELSYAMEPLFRP